MRITFYDNKLKKCANDVRQASKKLGAKRAKIFNQRLDDMLDSETLEDTRYLPGRYHELVGTRKGQWSCDLDHPYRLIFEPHEDPIPRNESGQYLWVEIKGIKIIGIIDYH